MAAPGFLLGLLTLVSVTVWIYESYTDAFRLARIQEEIQLLEQLADLAKKPGVKEDKDLQAVYQGLTRELDAVVNRGVVTLALTPGVRKGLTAAAPWVVVALFFVPGLLRGEKDPQNALLGFIVFAVPFVFVGTVLPAFSSSWINDWLYPWGSFKVVVVSILLWQRRKAKRAT